MSSPLGGCPGEASRMDCGAGGLKGLTGRRAMSQLTVYLKLEPSDKSKKSSSWMRFPPHSNILFGNINNMQKSQGKRIVKNLPHLLCLSLYGDKICRLFELLNVITHRVAAHP